MPAQHGQVKSLQQFIFLEFSKIIKITATQKFKYWLCSTSEHTNLIFVNGLWVKQRSETFSNTIYLGLSEISSWQKCTEQSTIYTFYVSTK